MWSSHVLPVFEWFSPSVYSGFLPRSKEMHLVGKLAIVVNVSASGCLFLCASLHQAGHLQPSHDSDNDLLKNHRPECLYVNSRIITFSKLTFSWCKITHCYSVLCFPSLRILKGFLRWKLIVRVFYMRPQPVSLTTSAAVALEKRRKDICPFHEWFLLT